MREMASNLAKVRPVWAAHARSAAQNTTLHTQFTLHCAASTRALRWNLACAVSQPRAPRRPLLQEENAQTAPRGLRPSTDLSKPPVLGFEIYLNPQMRDK